MMAVDLSALWESRAKFYADDHATMDTMVGCYFGALPKEFDDYFHKDMHVHVVNLIRLAWDDTANLAGKIFPISVESDNDKPTAKERAEKQEKIGYWYNEAGRVAGGVSMRLLMKVIMWWMTGCANAVMMVLPDFKNKNPYFTFRDPRNYYPPVGWSPYTQAAPDDGFFAYQMTLAEIKARFPDARGELDQKFTRRTFGKFPFRRKATDDEIMVWVGEYYTEDTWAVATLTDQLVTLTRSDSGDRGHPGVNPVVPFGLYSPNGAKGRSMFADQISLQAAMARMFSQKLDYFDRALYPLIFHTPLAGKVVRIGPYALNEYDVSQGVNPRLDAVAPQQAIDADQTMGFVMGMQRMLNRNPEQFQGQAPSGRADSAKALSKLAEGVTDTIKEGLWPPVLDSLPLVYERAARMDVNLWGGVHKTGTGQRRTSGAPRNFRMNYLPNRDIRGRERDFMLEPGMGLAGIQGTMEILSLLGAEMISEDEGIEQLQISSDPTETKRKIMVDRIEKITLSDLAAKASRGELGPGALAEIRRRTEGGEDMYEVMDEMDKAGRLLAPPPQPALGPGSAGGPGGPGGALAALLGGGAPPALPARASGLQV